MKKVLYLVLISLITSVLAFNNGIFAQSQLISSQGSAEHVPGEILVKFKPGVSVASINGLNSQLGTTRIQDVSFIGVQHLKISEGISVEEAVEMYQGKPEVEYAQPNYIYHALVTPDDTHFDNLWGLHNTGQTVNGTAGTADCDIDAPEAWDRTTGSSDVVIAVIDSGVDYNQPDLIDNIWSNSDEVTDGTDTDGNGYIDDIRGWDFVDNDNEPLDYNGHGSHVAGTIAAKGNNTNGITGVMWIAKIMPVRFLDASGSGTTANAVLAIQYAYNNGAKVLNNSWGGGSFDQALKDAITASHTAGTVFVAAAGNDGTDNDTSPEYPAGYDVPNIISVAGTDQNDALASWSNYGATTVDVAAPGVNIYSTVPAREAVFTDDLESGSDGWTAASPWALTEEVTCPSPTHCWTDSPGVVYANDIDISLTRTTPIDLSGKKGSKLIYYLRLDTETYYDWLYIEASTNGTDWANVNGWSGSTSGSFTKFTEDLSNYDGESTVYIRFRLETDSSNVADGAYLDDIQITVLSSTYDGSEYEYKNGTSMSAPHVAGLAGLIWAQTPGLTNTVVKNFIMQGVDAKSGLSGKMVSGGRINAFNSLLDPRITSISPGNESHLESSVSVTITGSNFFSGATTRLTKNGQADINGGSVSVLSSQITCTFAILVKEVGYWNVVVTNSSGLSNTLSGGFQITSPSPGITSFSPSRGGCFIASAAYSSYTNQHEMIRPSGMQNDTRNYTNYSEGIGESENRRRGESHRFTVSPFHPVNVLQRFRDQRLLTNPLGRAFVSTYCKISPPIAEFISNEEILKAITRSYLKPVVWVANKLIRK